MIFNYDLRGKLEMNYGLSYGSFAEKNKAPDVVMAPDVENRAY